MFIKIRKKVTLFLNQNLSGEKERGIKKAFNPSNIFPVTMAVLQL